MCELDPVYLTANGGTLYPDLYPNDTTALRWDESDLTPKNRVSVHLCMHRFECLQPLTNWIRIMLFLRIRSQTLTEYP